MLKVIRLKTLQKSTQGEGTPVRAILFDYGMVLSAPPNPEAWSRMRTLTTLEEERFHRGYWTHRDDYDRGTYTSTAYWNLIAAEAGLPAPSPETLNALLDADTDLWTDLNLPMAEWAQSLLRAGIPTGILSNMPDAMEAGVLRKHPWLAGFNHLTWSHRLRTAKPDPAIYRHAADGLGVSPFNILFLDDKLENIEAARNCGMQTIQYGTHDHFLEQMKHLGLASLLEDPPQLPHD